MSTIVRLTKLEDTKKLVDRILGANARVSCIAESSDRIEMQLESEVGNVDIVRGQKDFGKLPRDSWLVYGKIPGSPYQIRDDVWSAREDHEELIKQHERLWQKYFHKDWKDLDFLLGQRGPSAGNVKEPTTGQVLFWIVGVPVGFLFTGFLVMIALLLAFK